MNKSFGTGACCPPRSRGITYLKLGSEQAPVGMSGIVEMFEQLYVMGRAPEDATDEELIGMARVHNYIVRRAEVEARYAEALRKAYKDFCRRKERDLGGT